MTKKSSENIHRHRHTWSTNKKCINYYCYLCNLITICAFHLVNISETKTINFFILSLQLSVDITAIKWDFLLHFNQNNKLRDCGTAANDALCRFCCILLIRLWQTSDQNAVTSFQPRDSRFFFWFFLLIRNKNKKIENHWLPYGIDFNCRRCKRKSNDNINLFLSHLIVDSIVDDEDKKE